VYEWGTNVPGPPVGARGVGLCRADGVAVHTGYTPSPVIAGRGFTGEPGEPGPRARNEGPGGYPPKTIEPALRPLGPPQRMTRHRGLTPPASRLALQAQHRGSDPARKRFHRDARARTLTAGAYEPSQVASFEASQVASFEASQVASFEASQVASFEASQVASFET